MSHTPPPQTYIKTFDLKANGEVSRMRNHRGNMPSLPQTKCCALCPAKFTRTTHLNRHLRSHNNERAHRCSNCNAEFTRSDLLTRHKRTCGDTNATKSRRKSCQACVESKVKCNLEQPCSKCSAKGKECIFINDPGASRHKKGLAMRRSPSVSPSEEEAPESPLGLENPGSSTRSSTTISHISHNVDNIPHHIIPPYHPSPQFLSETVYGIAGASNVADSSGSSSHSSPQLDSANSSLNSSNSFHAGTSFSTMELNSDLHNLFPNVPHPYIKDSFKISSNVPWVQPEPDVSPWSELNQTFSTYSIGGPHVYSQPLQGVNHDQSFVSGLTNLTPSSFSKPEQPFSYPPVNPSAPISASSASGNPTTEELNQYLYLFFTEFSTHIPLLHQPTWSMESTHPVLVKAMRACGALFTKTMTATNFIITTLTSSQDMMLLEFSKPSCTLQDHICIMLAMVLLQSIGLLHPRLEQRSSLRMHHDVLVTMIRKTGLIKMIKSWSPPDLSDQASLESAWVNWAHYETLKRTLVLAYLQDCSYCIYYSMDPSFLDLEIEIYLPCDDALWRAQTSAEWYKIQQVSSPYGIGLSRLLGTNMQFTLASLRDRSTSAAPSTVNPFASFVLIHSILRDVFSGHNTITTHGSSLHTRVINHDGISGMNTIAIESSLHKWQKMWSAQANPETVNSGENSRKLPFISNVLPFYWLTRLVEAAKQKGTIHIGPPVSTNDIEDRYRLVNTWLMHISSCLLRGSEVSPNLWNNPTAIGSSTNISSGPTYNSH